MVKTIFFLRNGACTIVILDLISPLHLAAFIRLPKYFKCPYSSPEKWDRGVDTFGK
jgi:hypothetical protein